MYLNVPFRHINGALQSKVFRNKTGSICMDAFQDSASILQKLHPSKFVPINNIIPAFPSILLGFSVEDHRIS